MDTNVSMISSSPSNPNFPPSCPNGALTLASGTPPLYPIKFKIQLKKLKEQKTPTLITPLIEVKAPRKKTDQGKTQTTPMMIVPPCSECGKQFRSAKALHGHMRCHPERKWRGITPPADHPRPVKRPVMGPSGLDLSKYTEDEITAVESLVQISKHSFEEWKLRKLSGVKKKKRAEKKVDLNLSPSLEMEMEERGDILTLNSNRFILLG